MLRSTAIVLTAGLALGSAACRSSLSAATSLARAPTAAAGDQQSAGGGSLGLMVDQGSAPQAVTIFSNGGKLDHPLFTADSAAICAGIQFYDGAGILQVGAKACAADELPPCTVDGQEGCAATHALPAAAAAGLLAKILAGQTLAGVGGNAALPAGALVLAGTTFGIAGTSATGSLTLPAAGNTLVGSGNFGMGGTGMTPTLTLPPVGDVYAGVAYGAAGTGSTGTLTLAAAGNVRVGSGTFGRGGTSVTPTLPDCGADGATGCLAVAGYPAANSTGAADKILSGKTIAGVAGDVTLPAVGRVLAGTTFGVLGTASTGSLTVPAAGNILLGSGSFGIGGTAVTPTLTLPAAAAVRVSAGAFGIGGSGTTPTLDDCAADGLTGCVATASFKAAALANFTSGDVHAGVTVAGILGVLTNAPAACAADGATGCIADASYTAAAVTGLADKILAGQTVAGVGGDVTLPPPAQVLTGATFGVAGTGATGSLTVPTAGTVLASAGTFGVGGTAVTPILTLPGVGTVLAATAFGVAGTGSTGTLTVPSAANVRVGNGAYGALGSGLTPTLDDCAADGAVGCVVVGPNYAAAATSGALAGDIITGATVGGVGGSLTVPAAGNVLATAGVFGYGGTAVTPTLTLPPTGKALTGTVFGVAGSGSTGTLTVPTAGNVLATVGAFGIGGTGITATLTLPAAADVYTGQQFGVAGTGSTGTLTLATAANVRTGNGAFGRGGTSVTPNLADCAADGATGCVAVAAYPAANPTGVSGKILSGQTVAGVAGDVTLPPVGKVLAATTFGTFGTGATGTLTVPASGNVLLGVGAFGVGGTAVTPTLTLPTVGTVLAATTFGVAATGSTGTLTTPAAGLVLASAGAFGVGGTGTTPTLTVPAASDVYTGIQFGAFGTGSTGTLTLATAANVRTGNGAFGRGGSSVTPTLSDCATDGTLGCVTATGYPSAKLANFGAGNVQSGTTIAGVAGSVASCAADGATACMVSASYPAAKLANFGAGNVASGTTIAGVAGTLANCAADGATGCQTVSGFKAADMTLAVAGNIKSGATIAGVAGNYGAACSSDGQQSCVASGVFKAANISGISTWDLRVGQTLAGIAGALKTNCRNAVNSTYFNWDGAVASLPNSGQTSGTAYDYWDTVDDYYAFSPNKVTAWSSGTYCDSSTWTDVTTTDGGGTFTTCAGSPASCQYKDNITNLATTKMISSSSAWNAAISACNTSTYGGYAAGSWRLPTQKELATLYEHGIVSLAGTNYITQANLQNNFWSSSSSNEGGGASGGATAWQIQLASGNSQIGWYSNASTGQNLAKASGAAVLCVR